jgi:uncharacterized protein (TIGR00725 family)
MSRERVVGVIGAGDCSEEIYGLARELGRMIGEKGWVMVCGGLGGVMEAAARGCFEAGGMTLGILPGISRKDANPYIRLAIPTGLGEGRNLLVVRASETLVSIAGGYGTLSEIALALKMKKPVIGMLTWEDIEGIQYVKEIQEAISHMEKYLSS